MEALSFYDVKAKQKFTTAKWHVKKIKGRSFAVAKSPITGIESYRVLAK